MSRLLYRLSYPAVVGSRMTGRRNAAYAHVVPLVRGGTRA
jgi:hypothetical protein